MGIKHDLALLNITIFFEETSDFDLRQARMDSSNKEVRAWIDCTIVLGRTAIVLWWTTAINMAITIGGCRATRTTSRTVVATSRSWGGTTVTFVTRRLIFIASAILVLVVHGRHSKVALWFKKKKGQTRERCQE